MIEYIIDNNLKDIRLDKFVKKVLPLAPDSFVYKLFRKKDVKVNKKHQPMDYVTKVGDVISIYVNDTQKEDFTTNKEIKISNRKDFDVIYEDNNVLIVNKYEGLLVHEGDEDKKDEDTLTSQVLHYLGYKQGDIFMPSLAHRIDRNTSGVVVFGKTNNALVELFEAFKDHTNMEKEYVALVSGKLKESGIVDVPLIKNEKTKIVNVDKINGKKATTKYEPITIYDDVTLVKVTLLTGRTHQIRVHMKYLGYPLVGDQKYGNKNSDMLAKKYGMENYFLHARRLVFHNLKNDMSYLNDKQFVASYPKSKEIVLNKLIKKDYNNIEEAL